MSVGAPPHDPPATKSGRADCASYRRPRPGQRLDQPVKEASNESAKVGGKGSVGGGKPVNAWRWRIEDGIQHLHSLGLIHCEINPTNIVMDGDNPGIVHFDFCRQEGQELGSKAGTEGWTSENFHFARPALLIWSTGSTLTIYYGCSPICVSAVYVRCSLLIRPNQLYVVLALAAANPNCVFSG